MLACVGRRRLAWACVDLHLAVVGLRWPSLAFVGLRESALAFIGLRMSVLAIVGLCVPVLAVVGLRWPAFSLRWLWWAINTSYIVNVSSKKQKQKNKKKHTRDSRRVTSRAPALGPLLPLLLLPFLFPFLVGVVHSCRCRWNRRVVVRGVVVVVGLRVTACDTVTRKKKYRKNDLKNGIKINIIVS